MKASLAALALAATAQAAVLPTPDNAQIGLLHFPITCAALGLVNLTFDGVFTATAPLTAQAGQQIYYTDVTAQLTIPGFLTQAGGLVGISYADALVKVALELTNASPTELQVFPNGLWVNNTKLNPNGDTIVTVPPVGVLPPIGPVTMGAAGNIHQIGLGVVDLQIYLKNQTDQTIFGPIDVTCPVQDPNVLIGVVNIVPADGTQGTALAPANGFKPNFAPIGISQEAGCFQFDYQCRIGIFGPFAFPVTACGGINTYDFPGEQFYLENITTAITIPSSVVDATRNLFAGATSIDTSVQSFYIGATNAQPAALNGISTPVQISSALPASGGLTLNLPTTGVLRAGPFTAGTAVGQLIDLTVGNSTSAATVRNAAGQDVGDVTIFCQPPEPITLIGIIITNTAPQNVTPSNPLTAGLGGGLPSGLPSLPSGLPTLPTGFPSLPSGFPSLPTGFSFGGFGGGGFKA